MTAFKGLGTYGNAAGVVTPLDHKLSQAGQVVKTSGNTIRAGLFWGGSATIISGTAGMAYSVAAYACVTQRSASAGAVFGGNDGTLSVATTAAPGSNSRIDIIYHWHREYSLDGTDSNPVIGVAQGTAAAVPVAPSLGAFPGAIEIGRATVAAGATATNGGGVTITQTALFTAMAGGVVPVRSTTERDAGTWIESQQVWLIDSDVTQVYTGSIWLTLNPSGLIPVNPTSVAGTGVTKSANGKVSLAGAGPVDVIGCFQAGKNYLITIDAIGTVANNGFDILLLSGSTPAATAYDTFEAFNVNGGTPAGTSTLNQTTGWSVTLKSTVAKYHKTRLEITGPANAAATIGNIGPSTVLADVAGGSAYTIIGSVVHRTASAFDGFRVITSGTATVWAMDIRTYEVNGLA